MQMAEPRHALCSQVGKTSSCSCGKLCTVWASLGHLELLPLRSVRMRTGLRQAWSAVLLNAATGQV